MVRTHVTVGTICSDSTFALTKLIPASMAHTTPFGKTPPGLVWAREQISFLFGTYAKDILEIQINSNNRPCAETLIKWLRMALKETDGLSVYKLQHKQIGHLLYVRKVLRSAATIGKNRIQKNDLAMRAEGEGTNYQTLQVEHIIV